MMKSDSMVSQNSIFPKCNILYINRNIFYYKTWVSANLVLVLGFGMKNDGVITYSLSKMKFSKIWHGNISFPNLITERNIFPDSDL